MYYRLIVKRQDFHYEEFFAAAKPPTRRQLIKYYSDPDRVFGDMADMVTIVIFLLKSERYEMTPLRKNNTSGFSFDAKQNKYTIILQRLDIVPLSEVLDGE